MYREGKIKSNHFWYIVSFSELRRAFTEIFGSLESYGSLLCENICFSSSLHIFGYYFAKRELNLRFPECHIYWIRFARNNSANIYNNAKHLGWSTLPHTWLRLLSCAFRASTFGKRGGKWTKFSLRDRFILLQSAQHHSQTCKTFPKSAIVGSIAHLPKILRAIIAKNGARTKYWGFNGAFSKNEKWHAKNLLCDVFGRYEMCSYQYRPKHIVLGREHPCGFNEPKISENCPRST